MPISTGSIAIGVEAGCAFPWLKPSGSPAGPVMLAEPEAWAEDVGVGRGGGRSKTVALKDSWPTAGLSPAPCSFTAVSLLAAALSAVPWVAAFPASTKADA